MKIPVDKIVVPESRLSARFTPEQEAFFKASVEKLGVIHEPVVRRMPDRRYELIAGAHRLRELAAQGATEVECKLVEADDRLALEMNLIENVARGDYDPIQLSEQLNRYLELGASREDIAKLTGHTREWVDFYLALQKLPAKYREAVSGGRLKVGHVDEASKLPNPEEMAHALDLAIDLKWPVRVLGYYVKRRLDDLKLAKALSGEVAPPPAPPREEARKMVETFECGGCLQARHRTLLRTPPICEDCYQLLRYCTDQFGPPREAMGYIYQAVRHHQTFLQAQERYLLAQQQARVLHPTSPSQPPAQTPTPQPEPTQPVAAPSTPKPPEAPAPYPEKPMPIEDDRLRAMVKRVVREMLESHGH